MIIHSQNCYYVSPIELVPIANFLCNHNCKSKSLPNSRSYPYESHWKKFQKKKSRKTEKGSTWLRVDPANRALISEDWLKWCNETFASMMLGRKIVIKCLINVPLEHELCPFTIFNWLLSHFWQYLRGRENRAKKLIIFIAKGTKENGIIVW